LTHVEVSGAAVTRFSRRDIGAFTRKVLLALEHNGSLREPISEVIEEKSTKKSIGSRELCGGERLPGYARALPPGARVAGLGD